MGTSDWSPHGCFASMQLNRDVRHANTMTSIQMQRLFLIFDYSCMTFCTACYLYFCIMYCAFILFFVFLRCIFLFLQCSFVKKNVKLFFIIFTFLSAVLFWTLGRSRWAQGYGGVCATRGGSSADDTVTQGSCILRLPSDICAAPWLSQSFGCQVTLARHLGSVDWWTSPFYKLHLLTVRNSVGSLEILWWYLLRLQSDILIKLSMWSLSQLYKTKLL